MKHIIDIETWERRDNYNFFRNFHNSWISITSEVDCTEAFPAAKAAKRSFFLYYLYAVLRAANEVKEFRFRTDKNGQVVYHDQVDIISPIAVPGKTFYTVRIPYHADFERFYAEAYHIVHNIPEEGDPYGAEKVIKEQGDFDIIQLSATPQLYFTSLTYTQMAPDHPLDYPLMNAGKVVPREGRLVMPIAFTVNHAFVDGAHIGQLFQKIEEILKELAQYIIRKTKCFDFWERNVLFPKTKRSFFRTPKHPLPCPFPLNFSLLIITKKFGNLAKNRYICIV